MLVSVILSSLGMGLLIGVLVGLSASPVIGMLVAAITGLLSSFVGLLPIKKSEHKDNSQYMQWLRLSGIRAGLFGLFCLLGVFIGLVVRTHNLLSPSESALVKFHQDLLTVGFTEQQARKLLLTKAGTLATSETPSSSDSVLFTLSSEQCANLNPALFSSLQAAAEHYRLQGFSALADLTDLLRQSSLPDDTKLVGVQRGVAIRCDT